MADRKEYPRKQLVALLSDPQLATRLGALELLEEASGQSFEFNPWLKPSDDPGDANAQARQLWNQWSGLTGEITSAGPVLSEEQTQGYLRDIISGEADRKSRAIRMLDPHKLKGVASIQEFLVANPALPASSVIALKEAQYQLVLNQTVPKQAALLARDLTRGNQDQLLAALAALKNTGLFSIPIVRDFVDSPDALVRETAIDSILVIGGSRSVPLVIPSLDKEKDINVIHAAMRRLREIGGSEASDIAIKYLEHESEDMIVSALETLKKLKGGSMSSRYLPRGGSSSEPDASDDKIIALLDDPRWRVRASALEYIDHVRLKAAGPKVIARLSDEDVFVRSNAIDAVVSLKLTSANETLKKIFLEDDEMIASVTEALTSMKTVLPDHLIAHLDTRPPDIIVGAIKALDSDEVPFLKIVARYATHQNLDVSCTALRSLGDDYDKVKNEFVSNHLTTALQSGSEEKIAAVLNSLRLPSPRSSSYSSSFSSVFVMPVPTEKTSLDPLYNAFLKKSEKKPEQPKEKPKPAVEPEASGGLATLKETLTTFTTSEMWQKNAIHAFQASYILGKVDHEAGLTSLLDHYEKLTTSQRASIADNFYNLDNKNAITLLARLMQDDLSEIRKDAAYAIIYNENNLELVKEGFAQLDLEDTRLQPHEMYSYNLRSVIDSRKSGNFMQEWATQTLTSQNPDPKKILALAIKKNSLSTNDVQFVSSYTRSKNQWLRRAAWYALLKSKQSWATDNIEALAKDDSPLVREALPMALSSETGIWLHYFDDINFRKDYSSSSSSRNRSRLTLSAALETTLRELAQHDLSPRVRFESWFALMTHGKTIDLGEFTSLIGEQPKEVRVSSRLADHIEKNYRRMGKGMAPLLSYADTRRISGRTLPKVVAHFDDGSSKNAFNNFASLAQAAEVADAPQQLDGVATPEELAKRRQNLKVIVFYKPGCKECERAEQHLEDFMKEFPLMKLDRYNILEQDALLLNRALCDRFKIVNGSGKTPSFFTQYGAAITPAVKPEMLAELLQSTMETEDDPTWSEFEAEEMEEAKAKVEESFANITLAIVILGGLFDGVNPCAFATIIFFLSYLQVAKRTPKEILMVGISFITAIFLAYFSVGLVFHAVIGKLTEMEGFQWARTIMTWTFAFFAFLVAVLSLRDGIRASRGNLKDMTLQLPDFLKNRIRGSIRKRARASNYVIAAFVTGIIISFLELACTGQVYAPIVYQIQQGRTDAVLYLLIYNIAFILPLVIIFALAYRGMTSDALLRFQKNHTAAVKYATAALFFVLTVVILFGEHFLPHG